MGSEDELLCSCCCDKTGKKLRKRRKKHWVWVQHIYKEREKYGISYFAKQIGIYNREQYFK